MFWHFDHPDIFKKEILYPSTYKDAEHLEKVLYEMSGTRECYVIGECYIGTMQLRQACEEAWQGGICIIYCGNGIGYYQGRKSRRQMQFELERKGIPRELIRRGQEAMEDEEGCADETDMIRQLLEKRCRNPKEADEKEKRRHYGYLMRRGFTSSEIQSVFREYFSREE